MQAGDFYPQPLTPEQAEAINPARKRPSRSGLKRIDSMCRCGQLATYARQFGGRS